MTPDLSSIALIAGNGMYPETFVVAARRAGVRKLVAAAFTDETKPELAAMVDAIEWFRAPIVLGGEGRPAVGSLALTALAEAPKFKRVALDTVGDDLWERYERI